jgi:hypothetical protein
MADERPIPETRRPYSDPDVTFRADVANLFDDVRGSGMAAPSHEHPDLSQPSIEDESMQERIDDGFDDGLIRTETDNDAGLREVDGLVGGGVTGTLLEDRLDPRLGVDDANEGAERTPSEAGYDEAVARDDLDAETASDVDDALVDDGAATDVIAADDDSDDADDEA